MLPCGIYSGQLLWAFGGLGNKIPCQMENLFCPTFSLSRFFAVASKQMPTLKYCAVRGNACLPILF